MRCVKNRRRAFALPMVLVVLILGSVLVYVTYAVVSNLFTSSQNVVEKAELYNAALDGVEKAKAWIMEVRRTQGVLPRWESSNPYGELGSGEPFTVLLVRDSAGQLPDSDVTAYALDDIQVNVQIFDMDYQIGIDLDSGDYEPGFPPRMRYDYDELSTSLHQTSTYAGTNRGEGTIGAGGGVQLGFYLIRSTATFEERQEIIEQAMILRL